MILPCYNLIVTKHSKGFSLVIILVIITILSLFIYFQLRQPIRLQSPTVSPIPSLDNTENWKTYIHNMYNFSFKYPNDWEVKNLGEADPKILDFITINPPGKVYDPHAVTISFTSESYSEISAKTQTQSKKIILDNVEGLVIDEIWGDNSKHKTIYIPYGKILGNTIILSGRVEYQGVFNQILSTFRFLSNEATDPFEGAIWVYRVDTDQNDNSILTLDVDIISKSGNLSEICLWIDDNYDKSCQSYTRYPTISLSKESKFVYVEVKDGVGNTQILRDSIWGGAPTNITQ